MSIKILVTGANGQLGSTIKELYSTNHDNNQFTFTTKAEIDILNKKEIEKFVKNIEYDNRTRLSKLYEDEKTRLIRLKAEEEKKQEEIKKLIHILYRDTQKSSFGSQGYVAGGPSAWIAGANKIIKLKK